jgi:hypothetical protein
MQCARTSGDAARTAFGMEHRGSEVSEARKTALVGDVLIAISGAGVTTDQRSLLCRVRFYTTRRSEAKLR